ncbi:TetR/AcrR family transcriptional regulator [Kribbella sp. NPDC026611]|uniref:TetR/AcrR family transcriptional regulator n=1 Tax=Kribbella sp. NPDC026611 TaxID=3154911 RepID=UPI0033E6241E
MSEQRAGKRERLVGAAEELVYRQGVAATTLAHIAEAADVPLGNVYYYFRTKEDIVGAVVKARVEQTAATLAELEGRHRSPKARLKGLVDVLAGRAEETARFGCPYGTLAAELAKRADGTDPVAADLLRVSLEWAEEQFRAIDRRAARDLAVELIATYEGVALLAHTLGRPDVLTRQARRLRRWIDELPVTPSRTA